MAEMKEIIMFCILYSSVILGALAYTLDSQPKPQRLKAGKERFPFAK